MRNPFYIIILLIVSHECKCGLIDGLLSGAHETAGSVIGGFTHGLNLNFGAHVNKNPTRPGQAPGYQNGYGQKPNEETVVVIVEEHEGSTNNYGQGSNTGFSQHRPGYGHYGHGHHHHHHHFPATPNENEVNPPHYGNNHPNYGHNRPGYGNTQPGYENQQPGYWNHKPGYGSNQPGYGHNQPGYGNNRPGYGNNHPNYGNNRPGYGSNQPGYGNNQPDYGNEQPNYGSEQPNAENKPHIDDSQSNPGHQNPQDVTYKPNQQPNFGQQQPNSGENKRPGYGNRPYGSTPSYGSINRPSYDDLHQQNNGGNNQQDNGNKNNFDNNNPTYGNSDPNKPNQDNGNFNKPNNQWGQNNNDQTTELVSNRPENPNYDQTQITTKKPVSDGPLFVPLDPNQSDFTEGNDPKRETEQKDKPQSVDDDEDLSIDKRIKDQK